VREKVVVVVIEDVAIVDGVWWLLDYLTVYFVGMYVGRYLVRAPRSSGVPFLLGGG
jgi:hypothetical protein